MDNENKNDLNNSEVSSEPKRSPIVSQNNIVKPDGIGEITNVCTPPKMLTTMYLTRLGVILSNLSIVALLISLSSFLTVIATMFTLILGFMLMIVSCGTIFAIIPDYWQKLISSADSIGKVNEVMVKIWPVVTIIGIISAVASIVFLCFDKTKSHLPRLILSGVVTAVIVIFAIVMIAGGVK